MKYMFLANPAKVIDWARTLVDSLNRRESAFGSMADQSAGAVDITGGNAVFNNFGIVIANDPYVARYSNAASSGAGVLLRRARGSVAAPAAVLNGDILGGIYMAGFNSASSGFGVNTAAFYAYAMEDYTAAGHGSEAAVGTTSIGGSGRITRVRIGQDGLYPGGNNLYPLGNASARWTQLYAVSGTINTSDARSKQDIEPIPDAWLDAWGDVDWRRYRFIDAVQAKGEDARWHIGLIAQAVRDAFAVRGLDGQAIGLLCYDEWDAQAEKLDTDGSVLREARDAGDRWGLRYDECQAMEAAWQRRELARLSDRLQALEAGL
ncbi:Chaperone of endosialidase [Sphingobium faniae]|nr:Chaperone of endosialidase [Sphingobium faniae]